MQKKYHEEHKQQEHEYYEKTKEHQKEISRKNYELTGMVKIKCICGVELTKKAIKRHYKGSKIHKEFVENQDK